VSSTVDVDYTAAPPGFRLPADTRLGVIRLQVADLARSLDYYQRVLGLRVLSRDATTATATLGAHGDAAPLIELHERPGATPVPRRGRLGLYHFALLLPDRAALGRFLAHLWAIGEQVGMADHLVSEAIYLTDPDGLGIEVYADRPRSAWQRRGAALAMATDPLDVAGLTRAAGEESWTGMPAGTRIGHVHLFVDDLDRAADVFHAALGFDRVLLPPLPGALFLSAGGYHHHVGTNTWAARAPRATDEDARLLEWTIVVPTQESADAAARSLAAAGYAVSQDGMTIDPWGTRVRVVAAGP
jgi:catechol 2,3-dioxygenase